MDAGLCTQQIPAFGLAQVGSPSEPSQVVTCTIIGEMASGQDSSTLTQTGTQSVQGLAVDRSDLRSYPGEGKLDLYVIGGNMTDPEQNQSAPEAPAQSPPTESPRTTTEQHISESRKAAQGDVPAFFGSGTVEAPVGQAAPDVPPTAPAAEPAAPANAPDSSGDGS